MPCLRHSDGIPCLPIFLKHRWELQCDEPWRNPRSSTSKINAAFGGITLPAPCAPYAISGGIIKVRCPPTFIPVTPRSQPLITRPAPRRNEKGTPRSRELSNFLPFLSGALGS